MISQDKELASKIKNILAQTEHLKENTMKLTKKLIKKLVVESLEESPVGGSPEVVDSMTTTNPMDNHGENGTFEELSDGSFRLMDKQGNEVTLSPEEMEKLVAQYEESKSYEGGHEASEPVQEMGINQASLHEGRVTKASLQKIIKEEYKKLLKESDHVGSQIQYVPLEPGEQNRLIDGARLTQHFEPDGSPKGTITPELSGEFYLVVNGKKSAYPFAAYEAAAKIFKNPEIKLLKKLPGRAIRATDWGMRSGNNR